MVLRLKDVVNQGKSSLKLSEIRRNGAHPVFGASGLVGYLDSFQNDSESVSIIKDGAGIGRVSILPANSSVLGTMQFLTPKDSVDNSFLYYFLRHLKLGTSFTGSTIPHIYYKDFREKVFPLENKQVQIKKASLLSKIDDSIQKRLSMIASLDSLVKSRFNGQEATT